MFPSAKAQEVIDSINQSQKTVRYELAQRVRHQLRKTPELAFYLDDSLDYIEKIDSLLDASQPAGEEKELPAAD